MTQKPKAAKRRAKKRAPAREYVMPHTAAELGIVCSQCGAPAEWFDYERGRREHIKGFICGQERRSPRSEKLLVKSGQGISERCELAIVAGT